MDKDSRFVGLDVHAETIAVGVAEPGGEVRSLGTIPNTPEAVRRLVKKLGPPETLRVCYEAGPTGYVLYRQLTALGVACAVIAPTLVPVKAGDRVKTDRRDAEKLARSHRSGDLTPVWVPDADHEALRDLVRARAAAKKDQLRARHRLGKFPLRQAAPTDGLQWRRGERALERPPHAARGHYQDRQCAPASDRNRGRLGVPPSTGHRRHVAHPAGGAERGDQSDRLESAASAARALHAPHWQGESPPAGRDRDRPRAPRLHLGDRGARRATHARGHARGRLTRRGRRAGHQWGYWSRVGDGRGAHGKEDPRRSYATGLWPDPRH